MFNLRNILRAIKEELHPSWMQRVVVVVELNKSAQTLQSYRNDVPYFADELRKKGVAPSGVLDFAGGSDAKQPTLEFQINKSLIRPDEVLSWLETQGIFGSIT